MYQGAKINRGGVSGYADSALPRRSVHKRIENYKGGRTAVTPKEGAGQPPSLTRRFIHQAQEMTVLKRRVSIVEVACSVQSRITALGSSLMRTDGGAVMITL